MPKKKNIKKSTVPLLKRQMNKPNHTHTHTLTACAVFLSHSWKTFGFHEYKVCVMCSPCVNPFNILQNYFMSSTFFRTSSYRFQRKSYSFLFLRWTFYDGLLVSFVQCRAWIVVKITSWSQWIYLQSNVNWVMVIRVLRNEVLHLGFLGRNCNAIDTNLSNKRQG